MTICPPPAGSPVLAGDWTVVRQTRSNVLLTGTRTDTERVIASLLPHLRVPVEHWQPGAGRDVSSTAGTLVVREVDALDPREQRQLLASLQRASGIRVISVASQPLYPLVQTGRFTDALYYRLNVVYLDF